MDKVTTARFERLEKALSSLVDSIAKYHPSAIQAEEVRNADIELNKGLLEVEKHQNNHLQIQKLRQTSNALDNQIYETIQSLANTRKDITATRTTTYPASPNYPIAYKELLSYARRISKTTIPPAGTINSIGAGTNGSGVVDAATPHDQLQQGSVGGGGGQTPLPDGQQPSSGATPSAGTTPNPSHTPGAMTAAMHNGVNSMQEGPLHGQTSITAHQHRSNAPALPEAITTYLNPLSGQYFFPWPAEEKIRGGALASNQILIERGIDPKGYDPVAEEERKRLEEEERKQAEEKEKQEREEKDRQMREDRERARREREKEQTEGWRRQSVAQQGAAGTSGAGAGAGVAAANNQAAAGVSRSGTGAAEKKQFQFTDLDDLDDDDDDED